MSPFQPWSVWLRQRKSLGRAMDFVGSFPGLRIFAHVSLEATTFTIARGDANNAGMAAVGYKLPAPHQVAEDFIT
jgi:hypothetical protein